jgi:hypothetical protein
MQTTGRITALLLLATFAVACSDESLPFAPTTDTELPELAAAMDAAPAAHSANVASPRPTSLASTCCSSTIPPTAVMPAAEENSFARAGRAGLGARKLPPSFPR